MSTSAETIATWIKDLSERDSLFRKIDQAVTRATDARVESALTRRNWQGVAVDDSDTAALRRMLGELGRPEDVRRGWARGSYRVSGGSTRLTTFSPPGATLPRTVIAKLVGLHE